VRNVERLCLAHFWVAFAAFLAAAFLGAWQMGGAQPVGGRYRHAGTIFHVGDGMSPARMVSRSRAPKKAARSSARKSVLRRTAWLGISDSNWRIRPRAT
jgi:hypothetical protein